MTVTIRNLVGAKTVPTSTGALFTTSTGQDIVRNAVLAAVTNSTVALYKGVTATVSTTILPTVSLGANSTYIVRELMNQVFDVGESLWGVASVSGAIAVHVGGGKVT